MKPCLATILFAGWFATAACATDQIQDQIKNLVDGAVQPVMSKFNIPGMAVGVTVHGTHYLYNYGVASKSPQKPVTNDTLFELGSITKTFTATLAAYAQINGYLSLSDETGKYLPSLRDTKFGEVSLVNLGTHTAGGFPLQLPKNIRNNDDLMQYLMKWQPIYPPGSCRTYGNPGIGMLGFITAKSMGQDFTALIEQRLFPAVGMTSSFIDVPEAKMADYAEGYTEKNVPVRIQFDLLSSETGGAKSTTTDLIRFVEANMNLVKLDAKLQRAIADTHTAYFKAGRLTQDLIWEQYPYPVDLNTLLEGNSYTMIFNPTPATPITPPEQPRNDVWLNKTGTTNGFGAYIAFIPEKQLGIVLLANKSYPIENRVRIAYEILTEIEKSR